MTETATPDTRIECFTFGDPTPVLDVADIYYEGVWQAFIDWWEPPIPFTVLAKTYRATAHHGSALQVKRNILLRTFIPHPLMSTQTFAGLALDYLIFGNAYTEEIIGRLGKRLRFERRLAKYMRRGSDLKTYWWVPNWMQRDQLPSSRICHLMEPDIDQNVYGLPDYLGSLQSAWLNESANLFRRKYYLNGSHAGFILYLSDPQVNTDDVDALREALKNAKGPGNFRNLFLHSPNGKKDGLQLIPVSDVAAKDEFLNIKLATRDDQLAGHRIPPQLMGIVPQGVTSFGDIEQAAKVFVVNELEPLQRSLAALNDWAGEDIIRFRPYTLTAPAPVPLDPTK